MGSYMSALSGKADIAFVPHISASHPKRSSWSPRSAKLVYPLMTIELALLAASVILGILHIIIVSHLQSWQRGYWWTASSREQSVVPLTGIAGGLNERFETILRPFHSSPLQFLSSPSRTRTACSPCGEPTSIFGVASSMQSFIWPTGR